MAKLPAFQFYPGDWMKDPNLRRCTKAEKGVWMDAICLMFECEDRGVFASGGVPWTREEIAGAIGGDLAENLACLDELLRKGVASLTKLGAICNRRMVRDEEQRAEHRGRQHKYRNSHKTNKSSDARVTPLSQPSSSSSSTSSSKTKNNNSSSNAPPSMRGDPKSLSAAEQEERIYEAYPRKVGRAAALKSIRFAVVRLAEGNLRQGPIDPTDARRFLWKKSTEYANSPLGRRVDKDKIPHPATWFNQERYFDGEAEWSSVARDAAGSTSTATDKQQRTVDAATSVISKLRGEDRLRASPDGGGAGRGSNGDLVGTFNRKTIEGAS